MTLHMNGNLQEEREENQLKVIMQGDHDAATIKNRHLF